MARTREEELNSDVNRAIRRADVGRRKGFGSRGGRGSRDESDSRGGPGRRGRRGGQEEDENESIIYESGEIVEELQMSDELYATFQM